MYQQRLGLGLNHLEAAGAGGAGSAVPYTGFLSIEGDFSGFLSLEGDFSGTMSLEGDE